MSIYLVCLQKFVIIFFFIKKTLTTGMKERFIPGKGV